MAFDRQGERFAKPAVFPSSATNTPAEKTVLSALARHTGLFFTSGVKTSWFYDPKHRLMFQAMEKLSAAQDSISEADVVDMGRNFGKLEEMGGEKYIKEVLETPHSEQYVQTAIDMAKNAMIQRRAIEFSNMMIKAASCNKGADSLMALANEGIGRVFDDTKDFNQPKTFKDAFASTINDYREWKANPNARKGLMMGIQSIDNFTGGLTPCYFVIGALSSSGKTALACKSFWELVKAGKKVFFASQEMTQKDIVQRIISFKARVGIGRLHSGILTDDDIRRIERVQDEVIEMADANGEIFDSSSMSLTDIRAKAMAFKRRHGRIDAVIVDYLQNIDVEGFKGNEEYARVSACSKGFKSLGKDLNCLMMVLSQVTPDINIKEPLPIHLRGSRQIMQDADVILMMNRHEDRKTRGDGCDIIKANFAKGRSIGEAEVFLKFETKHMDIGDVDPHYSADTIDGEDFNPEAAYQRGAASEEMHSVRRAS